MYDKRVEKVSSMHAIRCIHNLFLFTQEAYNMKKSKLILLIFVIILILGGIALFTNLKDRTIYNKSYA